MKNMQPHRSDASLTGRVTAPGAGGIAVLHFTAPRAAGILTHHFDSPSERKPENMRDGDIAYGRFRNREDVLDEILLVRRREDFWELNCHGGSAAVTAVEQCLAAEGVCSDAPATLERGEWRNLDTVRREAWRALVEARTARAARMLADQLSGALSSTLAAIASPEDAIALAETWEYARALLRPAKARLAGLPNAGKSSIMNRLLGYDRVITSGIAGTTVDWIPEPLELDGYPALLYDSPGLGAPDADDYPETFDLVVFVADGSQPLPDGAAEFARSLPEPRISIINKTDLPGQFDEAVLPPGEVVRMSALTGEGLDELRTALLARIAPHATVAPGGAVVFRESWRDALLRAAEGGNLRDTVRDILEGRVR